MLDVLCPRIFDVLNAEYGRHDQDTFRPHFSCAVLKKKNMSSCRTSVPKLFSIDTSRARAPFPPVFERNVSQV